MNKIIYAVVFTSMAAIDAVLFGLLMFSPDIAIGASVVTIGPSTKIFLNTLENAGLNPVPISLSTRPSLSVIGSIITFENNNIETFEYTTKQKALKAASSLAATYSPINTRNPWSTSVHIYQKDNLIVFYLGSNSVILSGLYATMGPSLINNSVVSVVQKNN